MLFFSSNNINRTEILFSVLSLLSLARLIFLLFRSFLLQSLYLYEIGNKTRKYHLNKDNLIPFNDNSKQMSVYSMKNNRNLAKVRCSCSKYGPQSCLLLDYLLIWTKKEDPNSFYSSNGRRQTIHENLQFHKNEKYKYFSLILYSCVTWNIAYFML